MAELLHEVNTNKFLLFHLVFLTISFSFLLIPLNFSVGLRFFILVLVYNVICTVIVLVKLHSLMKIWLFSILLSLLMIFPDWILADLFGILVFPELEGLMIGAVPIYMGLLWTIPINLIIFGTFKYGEKETSALVLRNLLVSILFLVSSEFYSHLIGTWRAENVSLILGAAIYIIPVEILYGLTILWAVKDCDNHSYWNIVLKAFIVMILYIGFATFFYFVLEILI